MRRIYFLTASILLISAAAYAGALGALGVGGADAPAGPASLLLLENGTDVYLHENSDRIALES